MKSTGSEFLFLMRKAPHGSIFSQEGLEAVLIASSYQYKVTLLFLDDGVFILKKNQNTQKLGTKGFLKTYFALTQIGVNRFFIDRESLKERGLHETDLIEIPLKFLSTKEIQELIAQNKVFFPF